MANTSIEARMEDNLKGLAENQYPGRGIVQGLSKTGDKAIQVYWLMGRSESSRARVLVKEPDPQSQQRLPLVRTAGFNLPEGTDTSLIIYNAMRSVGDVHVVSNGDQTDTIADYLEVGESFENALLTREYEPDAPNYTPRISGAIALDLSGAVPPKAKLGLIVKNQTSDDAHHVFERWNLSPDTAGTGKMIHTYKSDGNPLPSSEVMYQAPLGESIEEIAETYWESLNPDNRVALAVKGIDIKTGEETYTIINKNTPELG